MPIDLRIQNALDEVDDVLDPALPTLILAECVLCYMQPEEADRIFEWAGRFADRAIIVYEMVGLKDTFGQVMRRNLAVSRSLRQEDGAVRMAGHTGIWLTDDRPVISSSPVLYTIHPQIWRHDS